MSVQVKFDPDFRPGEWAMAGPDPDPQDVKSPALEAIYPEKDDYLTVSAGRYFDPKFAAAEWEAVWSKTWTCAGLENDLAERGSWLTYDLGPESIVVVRGHDGVVRAFLNACKHRGRKIVTQDFGRSANFVCSYHSWSYGLDGQNKRVTDRDYFKDGALCGNLGLTEIRCETWDGFLFVNLDQDAEPLTAFLDAYPLVLGAYDFKTMFIVKDVRLEIPCNWKVAVEAFMETYHAHSTHPQILPSVDEVYQQFDFYKNGHGRIVVPVGLPSPRVGDFDTVNPVLAYLLQEAGIDPTTFKGSGRDVRAAIVAAKRDPDNVFGLDYSAFSDSQITDDWNPYFFPNMTFNAHPEGVLVMRFTPHESDPNKSYYNVWVLVPKFAPGVRPPDYFGLEPEVDVSGSERPTRRRTSAQKPELGTVMEQDIAHFDAMQRGLHSAAMAEGVRLSEQEQRLQQFHAEIDRKILRHAANPADVADLMGRTAAAAARSN